METIRPSILMPDGRTLYPRGWMWVLAFAVAGIPWAIEEAEKPEFKALMKKEMEECPDLSQ